MDPNKEMEEQYAAVNAAHAAAIAALVEGAPMSAAYVAAAQTLKVSLFLPHRPHSIVLQTCFGMEFRKSDLTVHSLLCRTRAMPTWLKNYPRTWVQQLVSSFATVRKHFLLLMRSPLRQE